jgi:SGNH hydrolase-like domain, acetyltransferase AlgX
VKLKKLTLNLALMAVSTAVALVLCEFASRLFLNPADYLNVTMVDDPALGRRIAPGSTGFDQWGFRNPNVPESVDIVALGDSHTYGNCAKMNESWPHVLAELSGRGIYNLGLGGYGPNQYFHLFENKALSLKPRTILCGLYFGDDFENAFLITYGLEHWAHLRRLAAEKVNFDIWEPEATPSWHKHIRVWLSRHSVIYKLVFHGPLIGRLKGNVQIENATKLYAGATSLIIEEQNIREAFLPTGIARRLNQRSESVQEGMRITLDFLKQMNETCVRSNVQFVVVLIPTKETVFAPHLEKRPNLPLGELIDQLIADERIARAEVLKFLTGANIEHVDTLPALQQAVDKELYARTAQDMHPGKNGYRVIAQAVAEHLRRPGKAP